MSTPEDPIVAIDCSYPEDHARYHEPHPTTGKIICMLCHPPVTERPEPPDLMAALEKSLREARN